jgi:hypothetical protein
MSTQGKYSIKRLGLLFVTATAVLVGCSSFNNSFNRYTALPRDVKPDPDSQDDVKLMPETSVPMPSVVAPPESPTVHVQANNPCDVSPYAVDITVPDIPTKELQAAVDVAAIEKIERRHINELRQYIGEMRKAQRRAKLRFYEKCSVISK